MNAGEAGGQAVTKVLTLPRRAFTPPHSREHPYVVTAPRAGLLMPQGACPLRPSGGGDRACRGCAFCLAASPNRTFFRFTFSLWRLRLSGGLGEVDAPDSPSSVVRCLGDGVGEATPALPAEPRPQEAHGAPGLSFPRGAPLSSSLARPPTGKSPGKGSFTTGFYLSEHFQVCREIAWEARSSRPTPTASVINVTLVWPICYIDEAILIDY